MTIVKEAAEVLIGISTTIRWGRQNALFSCCWHTKVICENTDSSSGVIINGKNRGWYLGIFLIAFCKLCGQLLFHYLFSTYESPVVFVEANKDFQKQNLKQSGHLQRQMLIFQTKYHLNSSIKFQDSVVIRSL